MPFRSDQLVRTNQRGGGPVARDPGRLKATDTSRTVLNQALAQWKNLAQDRRHRRRSRDYYWGNQWRDTMTDEDGNRITEREYIEKQGRIPWQMNHIKPVVRNLKGQLRQNESDRSAFAVNQRDDEAAEMLTIALRQIRRINQMQALEADNFQEHLIGGKSAFKIGFKHISRYERPDVHIEPVPPYRLFYNTDLKDRRLEDLRIVGMLHDMTMEELIAAFAPQDRQRARQIERHYGASQEQAYQMTGSRGFAEADGTNFFMPHEPGLARVIEVWRKEMRWVQIAHDPEEGRMFRMEGLSEQEVAQENERRQREGLRPLDVQERYAETWVGYYLTPSGHILWQGETPYAHNEHPFVIGFAEFIDGEVRGLVDDLIDQQRLYNRMISVLDLSMSTAARGVLMIPEEMIPEDTSEHEFAEQWTKVNGVVVYQASPDGGQELHPQHRPEQVYENAIPTGAFEWLASMKQDIEDVSGVTGPVMGQTPKSGTPAALFQQQVLQANINNLSFFETYMETIQRVDLKALQTAVQFYDDRRRLRTEDGRVIEFDPDRARTLEYDVSFGDVADTATYRQLFEQDLIEHLNAQRLTFSQYLQMSSHPRSEALLKLIQRTNPLVEEARETGEMPPELEEQPPEVQEAMLQAGIAGDVQVDPSDPQQQQVLQQQLVEQAEQGDPDAMALLNQLS